MKKIFAVLVMVAFVGFITSCKVNNTEEPAMDSAEIEQLETATIDDSVECDSMVETNDFVEIN